MVEDNLLKIRENIRRACKKSGRNEKDVTIMAVTKTIAPEKINRAVELGITVLGENRVQEFLSKYELVDKRAKWHIIGRLQKNKVKYIADKVEMIHSVDSVALAEEIDRQCKKHGRIMKVLVEVNVSGEESKGGIKAADAADFVEKISKFENITVCGLMTMAPLGANDELLHQIFSNLYKISVDISAKKLDNVTMDCLSMGMSGDYVIAVEEGATIVRIGHALFQ